MAQLRKDQVGVIKDDDGNVIEVKLDRHILDPEAPEAVQVPTDAQEDEGAIQQGYDDVAESGPTPA